MLEDIVVSEPWRQDALCVTLGLDPDLFFPDYSIEAGDIREALDQEDEAIRYCLVCPVMAECREAGQDEKFGIWGGVPEWRRLGKPRPRRPGRPKPSVQTEESTPSDD